MFPHRLARDLGRTVRELLDGMTAEEYLDWMAFYHAEAELGKHQRKRARKGLR